jgi:hypothetical protein
LRKGRIYVPKGDEVTGGWRKSYNEKLHNSYSSPNIIRIIKSKRMRWSGYMASMGEDYKYLQNFHLET